MLKEILLFLGGYSVGRSKSRPGKLIILALAAYVVVAICVGTLFFLSVIYMIGKYLYAVALVVIRLIGGFVPGLRRGPTEATYPVPQRMASVSLCSISPEEFERSVCELLSRMGYENVEHVGGVGDQGVDAFADHTDELGNTFRYAVQCKRYRPEVSVAAQEMRSFCYAFRREGADRGIFVTTSSFTPQAIETARSEDIRLIDGNELVELFTEYGVFQQKPDENDLRAEPSAASWINSLKQTVDGVILDLKIDSQILKISLALAFVTFLVAAVELSSLTLALISSLAISSLLYGTLVWVKYRCAGTSSNSQFSTTPSPADTVSPSVTCPNCGIRQPQPGRYCVKCGSRIRTHEHEEARYVV